MSNRTENYERKFDFHSNHFLMVVPAGGLRSGYDILNDWNLNNHGTLSDHDKAVEKAREIAARQSSFDGVVAFHPPADDEQ